MLATLDFSEAQAVSAAYGQLQAQAQALALFPASTFDGAHAGEVGCALATLILFDGAAQRHQTTRRIGSGPDDAGRTLNAHLTPTGQDEVLLSLAGSHGENAFFKYVAEVDRYCLAGCVYRQRADRQGLAGDLGKVPEDVRARGCRLPASRRTLHRPEAARAGRRRLAAGGRPLHTGT